MTKDRSGKLKKINGRRGGQGEGRIWGLNLDPNAALSFFPTSLFLPPIHLFFLFFFPPFLFCFFFAGILRFFRVRGGRQALNPICMRIRMF
jgi:hypothetical protein